jgi:pimeloyl-ACP methyl ester carboxylesterase
MTETPLLFGPDSSLVGILTRPETMGSSWVAFLMFNAGVLSRIGPHRLNVKLARCLAESGETSLRFDLSGQGDSRSALAGENFRAQAVYDIQAAMDHLERHFGIRRFALIGICSGAVSIFATARADPRIAGVLMFDGHWYRSRWSVPVRRWKRLRATGMQAATAGAWRRLSALFAPRKTSIANNQTEGSGEPANPPREEFVRAVQDLVNRHVAVFFMYSGSVIDYYSYGGQFRDAFGHERFFDQVRCDFRPDLDHTFVSLEAQRRMIAVVQGWVPEVHRACEGGK